MPRQSLLPSPEPDREPDGLTRRRFLRWGLALPLFSLAMTFPIDLLAAVAKPAVNGPSPGRKPKAPRLLMLDPGHGGRDPGATGASGIHEKDITLDIVRHMAAALADEPDVIVKQTRNTDVFLPLPDRVKAGRTARADLFMSVHADSAPNAAARGLSAYTLSEKASDQFSRELAEKENRVDVVGGLDLPQDDKEVAAILYDLAARRTRNTAQRAKVGFVRAMGRSWRLLERPMRAANFAVLRAPDVPSILVETGFLSNPQDEALLCQPKVRQKIAQLMAREIAALLGSSLFG
jgi:N-acetylmuramoyl-L-alanine amidase